MTPQEAIRILHPDTTHEALSGMDAKIAIQLVEEACRVACEALDKQIEKEAEKALAERKDDIVGLCTTGHLHLGYVEEESGE